MPLWLDQKYLLLISNQLPLFKKKKEHLYNFRCTECGDSQKNKRKARGYAYLNKKRDLVFTCHNCGHGGYISELIKDLNPQLYLEYRKENYQLTRDTTDDERPSVCVHVHSVPDLFASLCSFADLDPFHPALKYLKRRQIPEKFWKKFYYAPQFNKFVNTIFPEKLSEKYDEPRLVIPFLDRSSSVVAFQGRTFDPKQELRYITITVDDTQDKVFGLDELDEKKSVFIVEGPLDSCFVPNSIAVGGSNFLSTLKALGIPKDNITIIFDKQPRNTEIVNKIEQCINAEYKICLFPDEFPGKDINEAVINGYTPEKVLDVIIKNTYKGLRSRAEFMKWKKV